MDALKLYRSHHRDMTDNEVTQLCQAILNAPGDRVNAFVLAKSKGWWKNPIK